MLIDCHVHVSALRPGHGTMSPRVLNSFPFRLMQRLLNVRHQEGKDAEVEDQLLTLLFNLLDDAVELDAAVILAFDAVHTPDGVFDTANTHLYVTNDFVIDLAKRHKKILFGASVHPYRKDAVPELERCIANGAALIKWLPITQGMDPA